MNSDKSTSFAEVDRLMNHQRASFTSIIQRDGDWYVALCPELDIASQGKTVEEARQNLIEAIELFFEVASPNEIKERLHPEVFITQVQVEAPIA